MSPIPVPDRNPENDLLLAVGRGDQGAFQQFYDRYAGPVYSMVLEMVGNRDEADDLLLEGMEEIWRKAANFDPAKSAAFSWTVMLFRARAIDRLRRRSTRTRALERAKDRQSMEPAVQEAARPEWDEERELVRSAVAAMGEPRGRLLHLSFFEGRTHQEIADLIGMPLGTVKSTIRRSLHELRGQMSGESLGR